MRILPAWVREFVDLPVDDRQLAEDLTSVGIAVESVGEEDGTTIYEMDLTTNRVDAMNHYGVAREASAIYDVELKKIEPKIPRTTGGRSTPPATRPAVGMTSHNTGTGTFPAAHSRSTTDGDFPIVVEDAQGCARYTARILQNVKIGPSPEQIARRLELLGSHPINNVADATNYTLNELGHPTHAFDLDLLEGGTIIVRRARTGEILKTLDGLDRRLSSEDLVIADAKKPVALAGVMGGFDSMITARTRNVLIESAWFDPATVRRTAKRLGMHTDASHRFERGADWDITPLACDRVAELVLESSGAELQGDQIDVVARKMDRAPIELHRSEVWRNLGIDMSEAEILRILRRLGFGMTPVEAAMLAVAGSANHSSTAQAAVAAAVPDFRVQVPSWRLDVEREIDLLEELARIYGYNRFPNTLPAFAGAVITLPNEPKDAKVRETMLALGYDEAISITFVSADEAKTFGGGEPLGIANPLSEESGYLRTSLLPGLLNLVGYNLNRGTTNIRLFEAGEVFEKLGDRHDERRHMAFAAAGDAGAKSLHGTAEPYTFFHMKGDIAVLLAAFQHRTLYFDALTPEYFHPGRSARVAMDGETVARFGQLHPELAAARKLRQDVYLAEVLLERLYRHDLRAPCYKRISRFPAVERDFSFVFTGAVTFEQIKALVDDLRLAELTSFVPAEIYRGEKVGAAEYSVLLHAEFQSQDRTLRDDEVAEWSSQIVRTLESLGGILRAQ